MFRYAPKLAVLAILIGSAGRNVRAQDGPTHLEPPIAEPGDVRPAPAESVVVPGQPRPLPDAVTRQADPSPAVERAADPGSSIQQTQFVVPQFNPNTPATAGQPANVPATQAPATSTMLYPEPPTPQVRISVRGPGTAPTGQELAYRLTVSNISEAKAYFVVAKCPVPKGAKLIKALPEPKGDGKELEWHLDALDPQASRQIEVVFKPDEGVSEIDVVGKVQFEHARWVKTTLATPTIEMKKAGPAQGVLHEAMTYRITIKNPGKVAVADVQVVDSLPDGLEYVQETANGAIPVSKVGPAPNQRTWKVGNLAPGATRQIEYRVMPRNTGDWTSEAVATATGAQSKAGCNTVVQDARLSLQVSGPTNQKATANAPTPYTVMVHNTGTAVLHNVRVSLNFPQEMRVAKAANGGQMFRDAVQWVLPKLEPQATKELNVSLIAPSAGLREVQVSARADHGLEQRQKLATAFEGIPALNWQTEGTAVAAPGQEVTYTITVKNPGSAPAKNVKVVCDLPDNVEFRQAQPAFQRGQGGVFFNPIEIAPHQTATLKVVGVARKAGEARFHFELNAEGMSAGPLKNVKATTISPGAEPKKLDPTRVGSAEPMKEPGLIVPVGVNPAGPTSPPARGNDR